MNKKLTVLMFMTAFASFANAECIMRTTSLTKVAGKIDMITDIKPLVSPEFNKEVKCSISARVLYKDNWETIYGDYTGDKEINVVEICVNAVEIAVRQFLASKEAKLVHSDQQMVCSDEPVIKVKTVQKGDVISLSEVKPHPAHLQPFTMKGTECRWFIEPNAPQEVKAWQGIICKYKVNPDRWTVVDKF